jgi:hypothetical protein
MSVLAKAYASVGRLDQALLLLDDLLERLTAKLGPNDPNTRNTADFRKATQKALDAAKRYDSMRNASGASSLDRLLALRDVAQYRLQLGDLDGAERSLVEVLDGMKALKSDDPIRAFTVGVVRQCLEAREKQQPEKWKTVHCKVILGGALLGQEKYADAERLLLAGYEALKTTQREAMPAALRSTYLIEALERIVALYEATKKSDEVARWLRELDAVKADHRGSSPATKAP